MTTSGGGQEVVLQAASRSGKLKPYYTRDGITLYCGDCRDVLQFVTYDAIITDPPYGVNKEDWDTKYTYDVIDSCRNACNGVVVSFGAASTLTRDLYSFEHFPDRVLIWAPRFTLSKIAKDGLAYRWHPIFVWNMTKVDGQPPWDFFDDPTECGNWWEHSCSKPVELMKKLCRLAAEDAMIVDPFVGSGSTLVAAKQLGRHAIGIEQNEAYCDIARRRLQQEPKSLFHIER